MQQNQKKEKERKKKTNIFVKNGHCVTIKSQDLSKNLVTQN